jgi:hypothetical protein
LFSFGAVLYEMLSGKRSFGGETSVEVHHTISWAGSQNRSVIRWRWRPALARRWPGTFLHRG